MIPVLTFVHSSIKEYPLTSPFKILLISIFLWACQPPETTAQTVYVTKTGSKYHTESCRYLKYSKYAISLSNALAQGYDACLVCRPPHKVTGDTQGTDSTQVTPIPTPAPQNDTIIYRQCSAIAKSTGKRCKRITKNISGKCWQHE